MNEPAIFKKLKEKWGIRSNWELFLINLVFACAGMLIVYERKPIFHLLGITSETALWIKVAVYIPVVFPFYQLNLLIFALLLGQFSFFWEKQKKVTKALVRVFSR